jgi:Formate hydrogenlyase subunit 3/Multisubunit Na+/H+ antiporter, MnhD subunit
LQANDFFTIFVFIELMTIISTILIVYKRDSYSFRAGFYYLLFNSIGMMFYLIGVAVIYQSIGTLNMTLAKEILPSMFSNPFIQMSYIFIIVSMGVKSAFFPVYNWLPKAHGAAPAAVSALLSGLLVKSGLYVFIKIGLVFQPWLLKEYLLYIGLITSLSGTIFAIAQKRYKAASCF